MDDMTINNSEMNQKDFTVEAEISSRSKNTTLPNQQTFGITQTDRSDLNSSDDLELPKKLTNSMRQQKEFLKGFYVDHEQEILGTMFDRLHFLKRVDFMELLQSCEEFNSAVNVVYSPFSADDRLRFFKTYPEHFFVDKNFISLSKNMKKSPPISSEELSKWKFFSNMQNIATVQFKSDENHPGKKVHLASDGEKGLNASAEPNSPEDTIGKAELDYMDMQQYNASGLLPSHRRKVIEILLALLKIGKQVHFLQLCKLAENLSRTCQHFFHFFSMEGRFRFLKSFPEYFYVGDDNFVTPSSTADTFSAVFMPCKEFSSSDTCSSNDNATNKQSQDVVNLSGVDTIARCVTSTHNGKSLDCSRSTVSSTKGNPLLPPISSSASEVVSQNSNIKSFFQTILQHDDVLHFEELFAKLEDSNRFMSPETLVPTSSKLKFFEDHPDVFIVHSRGYISLVPEADIKSAQVKESSVKGICK